MKKILLLEKFNRIHNYACKKIIFCLAFQVLIAFIISCAEPVIKSQPNVLMQKKWKDKNTFELIVIGYPDPELSNTAQRRGTAREAALIFAQQITMELFAGYLTEKDPSYDRAEAIEFMKNNYNNIITGGTITEETYDENDNCKIVYEVRSKDLKKIITE